MGARRLSKHSITVAAHRRQQNPFPPLLCAYQSVAKAQALIIFAAAAHDVVGVAAPRLGHGSYLAHALGESFWRVRVEAHGDVVPDLLDAGA